MDTTFQEILACGQRMARVTQLEHDLATLDAIHDLERAIWRLRGEDRPLLDPHVAKIKQLLLAPVSSPVYPPGKE